MASSKNIFESYIYRAGIYAAGVFRGVGATLSCPLRLSYVDTAPLSLSYTDATIYLDNNPKVAIILSGDCDGD